MESFAPSVRIPPQRLPNSQWIDEHDYTPTGREWLLAFALAGCEWAVKMLEEMDRDRWLGEGI